MKKARWSLSGAAVGACLYALASPAFAQEEPKETPKDEARPDAQDEAAPPESAKPDAAAAVKTVDTWEASGESKPETLEETFFRLSRDFVTTSDDGFRRLGTVPIWPRGEFKIGSVRFFPYLRQAVEFEDNVFRQPNTGPTAPDNGLDRQWTHVNEVGAIADTALMGGRLRISGSADSVWKERYGSDAPADAWDLDSQVGATYTWPSGIWARGGVAYIRRHDPEDLPLLSDDFGRTTTRTFFSAGMERDVFFGSKFRFEGGVQTNNEVAQDHAFDDLNRDETTVYLKASYPFLRETTRVFGLVRYRWDKRQSESLNDGKTVGFNVGVEGSIPLREGEYRSLRGQVSVGFDSSLYSNDVFQRGTDTIIADENRQSTQANVQALLQYLMSPRSSLDLRYLHQTEFSFYGNYQVVDRADLSFTHNFTRQLTGRASVFYEHTDPSGHYPQETIPPSPYTHGAPNVSREGVGVGVRYAWNEWMDVDLSADVENRNDHTFKTYRNYRGVLGLTFYLNAITPKTRSAVYR